MVVVKMVIHIKDTLKVCAGRTLGRRYALFLRMGQKSRWTVEM